MPPPTDQKEQTDQKERTDRRERTDRTAAFTEGLDRLETASAGHPAPGGPARRWAARLRTTVTAPALSVLALLLLWQGAYGLGLSATLPSPAAVASSLGDARRDGTLWPALGHSLLRTVAGFAVSVVLGTLLGLLVHRVRAARGALAPVLSALQSLPAAGLVPLGVIVFGESEAAVYAVVLLGAVPSVALGVAGALGQIPPLLLRAGRSLGATGPALVRHILLPAALPGLVAALRQGWTFGWRALMTAELITATPLPGVGRLLNSGKENDDTALVLAAVLLVLTVGVVMESALFTPVERRVLRARGLLPAQP
ncbi:ABC transporter permease subunit [Streptomyces sp. NBC_01335]|uniref:ABC transporter permease n=1 Tax=Streptomyces sp. NBC_01335 TaxID=2903828 RepID=UPI002E14ED48|nr:ABC transporter permease subunit [Streptomyces sp. NBC_01335]